MPCILGLRNVGHRERLGNRDWELGGSRVLLRVLGEGERRSHLGVPGSPERPRIQLQTVSSLSTAVGPNETTKSPVANGQTYVRMNSQRRLQPSVLGLTILEPVFTAVFVFEIASLIVWESSGSQSSSI